MIELTHFIIGLATGLLTIVIGTLLYFKHYNAVIFRLDLKKLNESIFAFVKAIEDMKLTNVEKQDIFKKLHDVVEEKTKIVRIEPSDITVFTKEEVKSILKEKLQTVEIKRISDGKYYTVSKEKWKELIKNDFIEHKKYAVNEFDCDDFALCIVARMREHYLINGIFECWGLYKGDQYHAWNVIVTDKKEVFFLEPQTDAFFRPEEDASYVVKEIWM